MAYEVNTSLASSFRRQTRAGRFVGETGPDKRRNRQAWTKDIHANPEIDDAKICQNSNAYCENKKKNLKKEDTKP